MIHLPEHLPGIKDAAACIATATDIARDFAYVRQRWLDSDIYLFGLGLKLYWSDWHGHPNRMTALELHNVLSQIPRVRAFRIYACGIVGHSDDAAIHRLGLADGPGKWSQDAHLPKRSVRFDRSVYRQIMCVAELAGGEARLDEIERVLSFDAIIFSG